MYVQFCRHDWVVSARRISSLSHLVYICVSPKGLSTLQKIKLCHRNLSMEKLLVRGDECIISSLGWALRVPTSDDGSEVYLLEPQSACGKKPEYIAPEVFRGEPFDGFAVDLWAAGVVLYLMLFGNDMLFAAPIPEDPKFQEICVHGHLKAVVDKFQALAPDSVKPVSDQAIDLLQNMLRADPAERLTLEEVQEHPWMKA
jgi:serine/threonine protein kinase